MATAAEQVNQSALEAQFSFALEHVGCSMEHQFRFDPTRRWKLDFSHPSTKVAVEIDGGEFVQGAHTRGARMAADYEKRNEARLQGWTVFTLTGKQVRTDPLNWARKIAQFIEQRMEERDANQGNW